MASVLVMPCFAYETCEPFVAGIIDLLPRELVRKARSWKSLKPVVYAWLAGMAGRHNWPTGRPVAY